ncbi:hypothetical protein L3X38_004080 [Prunus dulcis]|uniref:Uncharacterized protein n=1 Tax=Prunus dulcis TaxID=3755 RepID=A0AAD4ZNB1_PRUDU|nr:hypothetical protein L3X38_004080 [Prunus dulcis]
MPVQPTPRMGPVSTPDNLRHARPEHHITISAHTPVQPTPRMGSINTPDNLCQVRPHHTLTRSPHTPVQPTPRMGPVRTPDNLPHLGPNFHSVAQGGQYRATAEPVRGVTLAPPGRVALIPNCHTPDRLRRSAKLSALGLATFSPARKDLFLGAHGATSQGVTHPGIAPASNSLNFGVPTNPKPVSSQKASSKVVGPTLARYCPLWAWLHSHQPARICFWELTEQLHRGSPILGLFQPPTRITSEFLRTRSQ